MDKPQELFALVLSPTRELAIQIAEQVEALGAGIGVRCAVLVGGIDMMAQAIALGKRPHVVVGTPGRVVDHLSNTKVRQRRGRGGGEGAAAELGAWGRRGRGQERGEQGGGGTVGPALAAWVYGQTLSVRECMGAGGGKA